MEREWPWRMTATFLMTQRTCRRVLRTGRPELPISLIVCIKKTLRWRDTGWVEILLLLSHLFSVAVYSWRTFVEGTTIFHLSWRYSNYSLEGVNLCRCVNRYHRVCIRLFCPLEHMVISSSLSGSEEEKAAGSDQGIYYRKRTS